MGADFMCSSVPAAHISNTREEELKRIVADATEDDFVDLIAYCYGEIEASEQESEWSGAKELILGHIETFAGVGDSREVGRCSWPGMDHDVFITGGMSWGDSPTEAFESFNIIGLFPPVYNQLEEWAKQDFKAS
jgi:hypothetical protein